MIVFRVLMLIPTLFAVTVFAFCLTLLVPGDPVYAILGESASPEAVAAVRAELGLDKHPVERYLIWLGSVIQGDFGTSLLGATPVLEAIMARLPVTISLVVLSVVVIIVIAVPSGILAGYARNPIFDRIAAIAVSVGQALPPFWLGLVFVAVFALGLNWFPPYGYMPVSHGLIDHLRYLVLPAVALAIPSICELFLQTRSAATDVFSEDYIRTARAAGQSGFSIVARWGGKNAMVPVVTVVGLQMDRLIGVAAPVETVFGMQGVGSLAVTSALNSDTTMLLGIIVVVGAFVLLLNLLVDLSYMYFNPKLRAS
ncbi:ABC transporter permease [Microbacterium soli]|uniref:ABC transporter permease n=1 Tax=Microbacterium soli TaxID=446075 RepID=A0ABP7MW67_9MICO